MSDDDLGLDIDADAERPAAWHVGPPAASDAELLLDEHQHRHGGARYPGAGVVPFTVELDGEEVLEAGEGEKWARLMSWPRHPTVLEVMAFKANAEARLSAEYFEQYRALAAAGQE